MIDVFDLAGLNDARELANYFPSQEVPVCRPLAGIWVDGILKKVATGIDVISLLEATLDRWKLRP